MVRNYIEFLREYPKSYASKFGLMCFSKTEKSILMWSHYARKHTGVVVEFETDTMGIEQKHLLKVEYSDKRISIKPTLDLLDKDNIDQWGALLHRKFTHWAYEEEIRIIVNRNNVDVEGNAFYDVLPQYIKAVYFGLKNENEFDIKKACADSSFQPDFYRMMIHDTDFSLQHSRI